jgi:hypothetical protein
MNWKKLGCIFTVDKKSTWMHSHAAVPFAQQISGDLYRVYFSARDAESRSRTGYFEIDLKALKDVLKVSDSPVLDIGKTGQFDDSGAMLSWITPSKSAQHYYYIGWNRGLNVPFRNSIGLAIQKGDSLEKLAGPVVDRSPVDPCFTASSCVLNEGSEWKMWYLSCIEWEKTSTGFRHLYHIKYATSSDGIQWSRNPEPCIDFADDGEYAISRPSVLKKAGIYHMWYSYRGDFYKIGYATSKDGVNWTRKDDHAGISVSERGWDSQMIEYPHVFEHDGKFYMLYNGNGYGETGIGLAVLTDRLDSKC